jgi:hypothetical protein
MCSCWALYCCSVKCMTLLRWCCKWSKYLLNMDLGGGDYDINLHIWCNGFPFAAPSKHPKVLAHNRLLITGEGRYGHARTMSFASMTSVLSKRPVISEESLASNGVFCIINIAGSSSLPALSVLGSVPRSDTLFKTESVVPRPSKGSIALGGTE